MTTTTQDTTNKPKIYGFVNGGSPGWYSVETAPKDGTRVLVFDRSWCGGAAKFTVSYWQPYKVNSEPRGSWAGVTEATHWMPLPAAPVKEEPRG